MRRYGKWPDTWCRAISFMKNVWRCPALPHPLGCSTIGAGSRNDRVRNGTGCATSALTTKQTLEDQPSSKSERCVVSESHSVRECLALLSWQELWNIVVKFSAVSTRPLHALRRFHVEPINPVISRAPHQVLPCRRSHLEARFPLRCFQRLSLPNVANQPCPWRDNWHTSGSSIPVLSY